LAFYPVDRKARVGPEGERRIFTGTAEAIRDDIGSFAKEGVETIVFSVGGREINQILDNIAWLTDDVLTNT
jgi:hypothetical protein